MCVWARATRVCMHQHRSGICICRCAKCYTLPRPKNIHKCRSPISVWLYYVVSFGSTLIQNACISHIGRIRLRSKRNVYVLVKCCRLDRQWPLHNFWVFFFSNFLVGCSLVPHASVLLWLASRATTVLRLHSAHIHIRERARSKHHRCVCVCSIGPVFAGFQTCYAWFTAWYICQTYVLCLYDFCT